MNLVIRSKTLIMHIKYTKGEILIGYWTRDSYHLRSIDFASLYTWWAKGSVTFGQDILKRPSGIVVTDENVFVTDQRLHALLQFRKKGCKLVRITVPKEQKDSKMYQSLFRLQ